MNGQASKTDVRTAKRHVKRCPASLAIRETYIKIAVRYRFAPSGMASISNTEQKEKDKFWRRSAKLGFPYTAAGNAKRDPPLWKSVDLAMPLLDPHATQLKTDVETELVTGPFTAALCTTAKRRTEPERPSTEERKHHMSSSRTLEYYLARKRNEVLIRATRRRTIVRALCRVEARRPQRPAIYRVVLPLGSSTEANVCGPQAAQRLPGSTAGGGEGALAGEEGTPAARGYRDFFPVVSPACGPRELWRPSNASRARVGPLDRTRSWLFPSEPVWGAARVPPEPGRGAG